MGEASPPRLLARTVAELWAAAMAMWAQLSEQAPALLRDWSFFYKLSFLSLSWRVWSFSASRCSSSHAFLGFQCCPHIVGECCLHCVRMQSANISCLTRASPL